MKKGFTLIELLAVIIILGIIALIAIPKVSNVIEEAKMNSAEVTGENYIKALQDRLTLETLKDDGFVLEGTQSIEMIDFDYPNLVNGEAPESGKVTISNGKVTNASFAIGNYTVRCTNNKCESSKENTVIMYYSSYISYPEGINPEELTDEPTKPEYLKVPVTGIKLGTPQACIYDSNLENNELCFTSSLNGEKYSENSERILNYFGFNENEWYHHEGRFDNEWYKDPVDDTIRCQIASILTTCENETYKVSAGSNGSIGVDHVFDSLSDNFSCRVNPDGYAFCQGSGDGITLTIPSTD